MSCAQTSLISTLSCEHGRIRRVQCDISERDLQRALNHVSRTLQQCKDTHGKQVRPRKFEYDGIIFIDESLRKEITTFSSPLSLVDVLISDRVTHSKAICVLEMKAELCPSRWIVGLHFRQTARFGGNGSQSRIRKGGRGIRVTGATTALLIASSTHRAPTTGRNTAVSCLGRCDLK
jgi:hypothetical protein